MVFLRIVLPLGLMAALSITASSEQLPIKTYATADGLSHDRVKRIVQGPRGFLWFCTPEGLSRFDGYRFINYGREHGLPTAAVNDLIVTRRGVYWVATDGGGVARFNPAADSPFGTAGTAEDQRSSRAGGRLDAPRKFSVHPVGGTPASDEVNVLYEDRAGRLWVGTNDGLFLLEETKNGVAFRRVDLGPASHPDRPTQVWAVAEDREGELWFGTSVGLVRRLVDQQIIRYPFEPSLGTNHVQELLADREGRIWWSHEAGLVMFVPGPASQLRVNDLGSREQSLRRSSMTRGPRRTMHDPQARPPTAAGDVRRYTTAEGLADPKVRAIYQTADGRIWVGTARGLNEFDDGRFHARPTAQGVTSNAINTMVEDRDGNLWLGTDVAGAQKIARNGFASFGEADGLKFPWINSVFEDGAGALYAINGGRILIHRFDGRRFTRVYPNLPAQVIHRSRNFPHLALRDHAGEWWIPTNVGLYRFPRVNDLEQLARVRPKAVYTTGNGLIGNDVFRVFEDSRGDLWIIGHYSTGSWLTCWERATETFHHYSEADGLPPSKSPTSFGEDASGNVWVGFREGEVARYRDHRFTFFTLSDRAPAGEVAGFYLDRGNRLWVAGGRGGATRIDDPAAEQPRFATYTQAEGLSGDSVQCVTEDRWGHIYFGTTRGIDRLDPTTGRIKHYTTADGLVQDEVLTAFRDRRGDLWFGTYKGLSRFAPEPERPASPPPILIGGVRIAGRPYPVSDLGATEISGLEFGAEQKQISIDFFGISFGVGEALRYQYMLEGADRDWSAPADDRVVNYPNLTPGTYRFVVRALSADGTLSPAPAVVAFRILPPVWQRWWFLALAATAVCAVIVAVERYRAARMRELNAALGRSEKLTEVLTAQRAELRKANRSLELEYAVTNVLADCTTLAAVTSSLLRVICEHTDWEVGTLWEVDEGARVLRCVDTWHLPQAGAPRFEGYSREFTRAPGAGLPGRVWESGEPYWITDLAADVSSPRIGFAVEEGLKSAYGVPILLEAEVIGVLEFFSREARQPDDEQIKMVSTIGSQIGQLVERKRAEGALRESEDHFRTLTESASDAIITIDAASTITSVNPAAEDVFGYETAEMIGRPLTMLMPEYMRHAHRAGIERYLETNQKHTSWSAVELPGLHKTGREIPLEISFCEWTKNGRRFFTGIARDVTERRAAEEALRRTREERLRELERVRTRIATDLHDDIGSSLTQIAILSEVARQKVSHQTGDAAEPLTAITSVSNELVETMSDIVWAINPKKDHLDDLAHRMRRFASDLFTARKIGFHFHAPDSGNDIQLGANVRREVFLIFKESVNNTVKHSGCTEADAEFYIDGGWLVLKLKDNGRGFDPALHASDGNGFNSGRGGNGLSSMRRRAAELGGSFEITTRAGQGTTVALRVPVSLQTSNEATTQPGGDTSA